VNDVISQMLDRYTCRTRDDYVNALREILQQLALLGLWRAKFFEGSAFYGGTALRVLYGLDRFSEDLDFSRLTPDPAFSLAPFCGAIRRELESFGFEVTVEPKPRHFTSAIEAAVIRTHPLQSLLASTPGAGALASLRASDVLRITVQVDTNPPGGFETEGRTLLLPVAFAVRAYSLPDLFAGKMHAVLCRRWLTRVKGQDWYDLVWCIGHHPRLRLTHLEARMRASGGWQEDGRLDRPSLLARLRSTIGQLDVPAAREEAARFVPDASALTIWSPEFFLEIIERIETE
jgi:hypothetical protein